MTRYRGGHDGLGVAIVTFGLSTSAIVGLAALFVGGIMYMISISLSTTLVQINAAEAHRGRVMALWGVAFLGLRPVACLLDGAVATLVNVRVAALAMVLPVLAAAVFIAGRGRRMDEGGR